MQGTPANSSGRQKKIQTDTRKPWVRSPSEHRSASKTKKMRKKGCGGDGRAYDRETFSTTATLAKHHAMKRTTMAMTAATCARRGL